MAGVVGRGGFRQQRITGRGGLPPGHGFVGFGCGGLPPSQPVPFGHGGGPPASACGSPSGEGLRAFARWTVDRASRPRVVNARRGTSCGAAEEGPPGESKI